MKVQKKDNLLWRIKQLKNIIVGLILLTYFLLGLLSVNAQNQKSELEVNSSLIRNTLYDELDDLVKEKTKFKFTNGMDYNINTFLWS